MPPSLGSPPEVPVSDTEASQQSPKEEELRRSCGVVLTLLQGVAGDTLQEESMFEGQVGTLQSVTSPYLLGDFKQAAASLDVMSKL